MVSHSSSAHLFPPVVFDDINVRFRPYDGTLAYALEGIGGRYFDDDQKAVPTDRRPADVEEPVGSVAPYSLDPENAERVGAISAAAGDAFFASAHPYPAIGLARTGFRPT